MKHTPEKNLTHIFGPVPSRRLGYSLGVDILPMKTCSVNCIYCELGRTSNETLERREYVPVNVIVDEIKEAILNTKRIDFISFSGSGEMIAHVKAMTEIPIAMLIIEPGRSLTIATDGVIFSGGGARSTFGYWSFDSPDEWLPREYQPQSEGKK